MSQKSTNKDTPIAHGTSCPYSFVNEEEVANLSASFRGKSVGQRFLGPCFLNEEGAACVIFIAHDDIKPARLRKAGSCGFIAWIWNDTPTAYFSLTLILSESNPRPHVRWFRPSSDPVVQSIRTTGKFYAAVVSPNGQSSGWFEAHFRNEFGANAMPTREALERLWSFPVAGIPYSSVAARFEPGRREPYSSDRTGEIPLWRDNAADFWRTLSYDGPWVEDLDSFDLACRTWGAQALRNRQIAAGFVQVLIDRQLIDGAAPPFDSQGQLNLDSEIRTRIAALIARIPTIGEWLAALAGPHRSAEVAYQAAYKILMDPPALYVLVAELFELVNEIDDEGLGMACKTTFESALLDARITHDGTQRPWLANTERGLETRSSPFDLAAPIEDIKALWTHSTELVDLLDSGIFLGPSDFPTPYADVCGELAHVVLDGTAEEAESQIEVLLAEAHQARQWSIPWGARVEIGIGPFTGLRIFELDGEFVCHFLDSKERYFTVAIGIRRSPPRISSTRIVFPPDSTKTDWNEDAELTLRLIAAAIVRDFLVVEHRESLFTIRVYKRRIRGNSIRSIIYLPRVVYNRAHPSGYSVEDGSNARQLHQVGFHLRRAASSSPAQRFLAQRYGVRVPEGFTFVRPHERGVGAADSKLRIYRSRSASRMIFEEIKAAPSGTRPLWFQFEKDCLYLLQDRGLNVVHQSAHRDGDGGIDLYAVNENGESWVVQCKCWAAHRVVGPEVIRELAGAIALTKQDGNQTATKGIVITTSSFTSGAEDAASQLEFELIDGHAFAGSIRDLQAKTLN